MGKSIGSGVGGNEYYAGMHFTLCRGPIDSINEIWYGEKLAWKKEYATIDVIDTEIIVDAKGLFGGKSSEGGIAGAFDIMAGYPDQQRNGYLASVIDSPLISAYRSIVSLVAKKVYWGNTRYPKALSIQVTRNKRPCNFNTEIGDTYIDATGFGNYISAIKTSDLDTVPLDMNPAIMIMEMLTSDWGRNLPENALGDTWFQVASTLYNERLGLSMMFTKETSIESMIKEVLRHIDGVVYEDPKTSLLEIKLIRKDYSLEDLPVARCGVEGYDDNFDLERVEKTSVAEMVNQVSVTFKNRRTRSDSSVTVQDAAAIGMLGRVVSQTVEYSGVACDEVALKIAERDLASLARQHIRGTAKFSREFYDMRPGDPFLMMSPDDGIDQVVCRVAKRGDADFINGVITIDFVEDVFGESWKTYAPIPPSGWVSPVGKAKNFSAMMGYEIPYIMAVRAEGSNVADQVEPDIGFVGLAGGRPNTGAHTHFVMMDSAWGGTVHESNQNFTPYSTTIDAADEFATQLKITQPNVPLELDPINTMCMVNLADYKSEMLKISYYDEASGLLSVIRGVGDSVPKPIPVGSQIFFVSEGSGASLISYGAGEQVSVTGKPVNMNGVYDGPLTYEYIDIAGRIAAPYPPACVRYNGEFSPDYITGPLTVSWQQRNRTRQSDQMVGWYEDSNIQMEEGASYLIEITAGDQSFVYPNIVGNSFYFTDEADNPAYDRVYNPLFVVSDGSLEPVPMQYGKIDFKMTATRDSDYGVESVMKTLVRKGWAYGWDNSFGE